MAHAARLEEGIVREVIVVPDGLGGDESDTAIEQFLNHIGIDGNWIRTSYNGSIRGCYAGIGYTYDAELDQFIPPTTQEGAE